MSLGFNGGSTDKVTVPNPQTIGAASAFSWLQWIRRTAALGNGQGTGKGGIDVFAYSAGALFMEVPRATTKASAICDAALLAQSEWEFWAGTYDESDGPRLFKGTLGSQVAEVAYTSRAVGAGATSADSGDLWIDNRGAATSQAMYCLIETFAWSTRRLSLAELVLQQFAPMPDAGCTFFSHLGLTGLSAPDWSGNGRTGQVASSILDEHPLLRMPNAHDRRITPVQPVLV